MKHIMVRRAGRRAGAAEEQQFLAAHAADIFVARPADLALGERGHLGRDAVGDPVDEACAKTASGSNTMKAKLFVPSGGFDPRQFRRDIVALAVRPARRDVAGLLRQHRAVLEGRGREGEHVGRDRARRARRAPEPSTGEDPARRIVIGRLRRASRQFLDAGADCQHKISEPPAALSKPKHSANLRAACGEGSGGTDGQDVQSARAALALALAACAEKPDVDQIAQMAMIGLAKRDILACLGEPARRRAVGEGTEIWTYPVGVTTTDTPPWGAGLNFAASQPPCPARSGS